MPNWNYNIIRLLFVSLWFITDVWELTLGIVAFVDESGVVVDESCDFCGDVFGKGVLDAASFKDSTVALAAAASGTSEPPLVVASGGC